MARIAQVASTAPVSGILSLEVRPWAIAASRPQVSMVLCTGEAAAQTIAWAEVIYAVNDVPLFHTPHLLDLFDPVSYGIDELLAGKTKELTWSSFGTDSWLRIESSSRMAETPLYRLRLRLSLSPLYHGSEALDDSAIELVLDDLVSQAVREFVVTLDREFGAIREGHGPESESIQRALASPPISRELTARAYDTMAWEWGSNCDLFTQRAMAPWEQLLPAGGHILDIGCGDGEPVAVGLSHQGFRVTGIDVSAAMVGLARVKVPGGTFLNLCATELSAEDDFDGACSIYSLFHLDPIALRRALWRIHRALKPGAPLLIVLSTPDMNARYTPLCKYKERLVWQWDYDPQDLELALKENGLFSIVQCTQEPIAAHAGRYQALLQSPALGADAPYWAGSPTISLTFAILARKEPDRTSS